MKAGAAYRVATHAAAGANIRDGEYCRAPAAHSVIESADQVSLLLYDKAQGHALQSSRMPGRLRGAGPEARRKIWTCWRSASRLSAFGFRLSALDLPWPGSEVLMSRDHRRLRVFNDAHSLVL